MSNELESDSVIVRILESFGVDGAGYDETETEPPSSVGPPRPKWTGPEEPGARSPSAWLERRNVGLRGSKKQREDALFYVWV